MDVAKIAQDKLNTMAQDGTIEKMVSEQVTKALSNIIQESFGQWGEWGKTLKQVVNDKIQINLDKLNLPAYNTMVITTIENHLTNTIAEHSLGLLKERMDRILAIPEKKTWKLSEIVKMYWEKEGDNEDYYPWVQVEEQKYGSIWIYIGKKQKSTETYSYRKTTETEIKISVNPDKGNKIWYAGSTTVPNPLKERVFVGNGNMDALLMTLWAHECILDIDIEDASDIDDIYLGEDD
jgi:hypothetical protein